MSQNKLDNLYHTIKAEDADEAIKLSPYFIGQKCVVERIHATANSDGTFHVTARIALVENKNARTPAGKDNQ